MGVNYLLVIKLVILYTKILTLPLMLMLNDEVTSWKGCSRFRENFAINNFLCFSSIPLFTKGRIYFVYDKQNSKGNFQFVTHFVQNICLHWFIQLQHLFGGNLHFLSCPICQRNGVDCVYMMHAVHYNIVLLTCITLDYCHDRDVFYKFLPCVVK